MQIALKRFAGTIPKVTSRQLPVVNAETALNCNLKRGELRALRKPKVAQSSLATKQSIYKLKDTFLSWNSDVDVVRAFVVQDDSKIIFTGDGLLTKTTNETLGTAGATTLAVFSPVAPTVVQQAVTGDFVRSTAYILTYVDSNGWESKPSPPSIIVDVYSAASQVVTLPPANLPITEVSKVRLYRVATGNDYSDYRFVTEFAYPNPTTYTDTVADVDLGEVVPSTYWNAPPSGMKGIISFGNGMNAGFVDNKVYISEPNIPYAFPEQYIKTVDSMVVGLGHFNSNLVVLTSDSVYIYSGEQPDLMSKQKFPENQGCVSKRSIVSTEDRVIFASPDGLFSLSSNGLENLTANMFTRDQWQSKAIEDICGVWYNSSYYGFIQGTSTAFVLDFLEEQYITDIDIPDLGYIRHAIYDPVSDKMFMLVDRSTPNYPNPDYAIYEWEGEEFQYLTYTWKSKEFEFPMYVNMAAGRVSVRSSPVQVDIIAGGNTIATRPSVTNLFRLPAGFKERLWQIQIVGSDTLYDVRIGTSVTALSNE